MPTSQKPRTNITVALQPDQFAVLSKLAETDRRKLGQLARIVLEDYIAANWVTSVKADSNNGDSGDPAPA